MYSLLKKIYHRIRGMYERRSSQYTRSGKIALCCIAKMENDYIRFFVEYYKTLHFDKIIVYDNNDIDGESLEDVIGDYISSGFVDVVDFRGRRVVQLEAYHDCYIRCNKNYDWIAFFDCDEFLTFSDETIDLHCFFSQKKFKPFQIMHINWKMYGDNEMLDNDGRNIIERFRSPIALNLKYDFIGDGLHYVDEHVKSIVRGGLSNVVWRATPHTPLSWCYKCCNPEGYAVNLNYPFQDISHGTLFLRHYYSKTIGEWVRNKMKRGYPDQPEIKWEQSTRLELFFRFNNKTKEKLDYADAIRHRSKL